MSRLILAPFLLLGLCPQLRAGSSALAWPVEAQQHEPSISAGEGEPSDCPAVLSASDSLLLWAIEATVAHRYSLASCLLAQACAENPAEPLSVLLQAASLQAKMQDLENYAERDSFVALLARARSLASQKLTSQPSARAFFCLGVVEAYSAYDELRRGHQLSAYRHGLRARSYFEKALAIDPQFCDAAVGIGSFLYWRGKALRYLAWLPFVSDRREDGIRTVLDAFPCTKFTRWTSVSNLSWILLDADRPAEALRWAEEGLARFPESRFFLWPAAEALFRMGRWSDSEAFYRRILAGLESQVGSSGYNELLCYLRIAECRRATGDLLGALESLDQALAVRPGNGVESAVEELRERASRLRREVTEELRRQRKTDVPTRTR